MMLNRVIKTAFILIIDSGEVIDMTVMPNISPDRDMEIVEHKIICKEFPLVQKMGTTEKLTMDITIIETQDGRTRINQVYESLKSCQRNKRGKVGSNINMRIADLYEHDARFVLQSIKMTPIKYSGNEHNNRLEIATFNLSMYRIK